MIFSLDKIKNIKLAADSINKGKIISFSGCRDDQYSADAYNFDNNRKWTGAMSSASNEDEAYKVHLSEGNVLTIEMKNEGSDGTMVFEPGVIKVSVGDTINFVLTDQLHNSASLPGMIPAGAEAWTGEINQEISITFDKEGVYVYNCTPHAMMAMVGVIQVGEASNINEIKSAASDLKSTFIKNNDRLDGYLSRL